MRGNCGVFDAVSSRLRNRAVLAAWRGSKSHPGHGLEGLGELIAAAIERESEDAVQCPAAADGAGRRYFHRDADRADRGSAEILQMSKIPRGERLMPTDLVDFDMCWAFDLVDPWGNQYELNCYDYDRVRAELVEADALKVVRYWPREVYVAYRNAASS